MAFAQEQTFMHRIQFALKATALDRQKPTQ